MALIAYGELGRLDRRAAAGRDSVWRRRARLQARPGEALAILAGEGLVQPLSNATAIVTRMSVEELQELDDLRLAIEPRTTEIAVSNVGRADVLYMRKRLAIATDPSTRRYWPPSNVEMPPRLRA